MSCRKLVCGNVPMLAIYPLVCCKSKTKWVEARRRLFSRQLTLFPFPLFHRFTSSLLMTSWPLISVQKYTNGDRAQLRTRRTMTAAMPTPTSRCRQLLADERQLKWADDVVPVVRVDGVQLVLRPFVETAADGDAVLVAMVTRLASRPSRWPAWRVPDTTLWNENNDHSTWSGQDVILSQAYLRL